MNKSVHIVLFPHLATGIIGSIIWRTSKHMI